MNYLYSTSSIERRWKINYFKILIKYFRVFFYLSFYVNISLYKSYIINRCFMILYIYQELILIRIFRIHFLINLDNYLYVVVQ